MRKKQLLKKGVIIKAIYIAFFILVTGSVYFITYKDFQKTGLTYDSQIKVQEVEFYLNLFNKERFTEEAKKSVRDLIKTKLREYGYNVTEQKTDGYINGSGQKRVFINLIADRGNITDNYILIGAHYDAVPDTKGIDDNASGLAAMLTIAKYNKNPHVRFVAFDGEEYNMSGSSYYVKSTNPLPQLMISLETMGYYSDQPDSQHIPPFYNVAYRGLYNRLKSNQFRGNFSASVCSHDAKTFCDKYESYASGLNLEVITVTIPKIPFIRSLFLDLFRSDHTPFLLADVPSVMITDSADFRTPNYHKPTDTIDTVNPDFITRQANTLLEVLSEPDILHNQDF